MTVRVQSDPAPLAGRLPAIAAGIDPTLVVHQARAVEDVNRIDLLFVRLYGFGIGFVVISMLLLSTAGVYSMLSFTVSQRTREIGIRAALGASRRSVISEVFSRAFVQLGSGMLLGLALALTVSAGPFRLSNGTVDQGPQVIIGVAAAILVTGLIACSRPLSRALRIQPIEALRTD
jgi:putative ABC transport system permease protein